MSFSQNCKTEILKNELNKCCLIARLYGIMLFGHIYSDNEIKITTENREVFKTTAELIRKFYGYNAILSERKKKVGHSYKITINDKKVIKRINGQNSCGSPLRINLGKIENECCINAFLAGAFLSCGSITNPKKSYHLEFETSRYMLSKDLSTLLYGIGLKPKTTLRKSNYILYYKESENIEDLLSLMGASKAAFEIMNIKIYKDLRNNANRVTNCETANITKTVEASSAHIESIKKLIKYKYFNELPDGLKEVAKLRLENPELSLKEIGSMLSPPISKSGVSHRLKRIEELARKFK